MTGMTASVFAMTATKLEVHPSKIHGNGVFATTRFSGGQVVFSSTDFVVLPVPMRGTVQRCRTEHILETHIIRWVNHSCRRNAQVCFTDGSVQLICVTEIQPGEEVVCDYMCTEESIPVPFRCNCGHCSGVTIG